MRASAKIRSQAGTPPISPHRFRFEIGGITYQYVVTSLRVGLVKLWRPDLVEDAKSIIGGYDLLATVPDSGDPDAVWPVLNGVTGLLFASDLPPLITSSPAVAVGDIRDPSKQLPPTPGISGSVWLTGRPQPSELRGVGEYWGLVSDELYQFKESDFDFTIKLDGESMIVTRQGANGWSTTVDLAPWFDRQSVDMATGSLLISSPSLTFEFAGVHYTYVVTQALVVPTVGAAGRVVFDTRSIEGHLFASGSPT